ncbi:hypothetical protein PR202_ga19156 [Eleusine coracana subsp. coracana]|uniref:Titin-like n=1 Tax=Eleusine coracana subsp. coracana TaxID=191504 RepID=A0AAV5CVN9_ELECO|nr:hypothetical protein PR202_ga19156 [Eleusine coracana subsp. coracana]
MDFHALPRRDLQALCKRNGVRANMANAAMADALSALPKVDGIEEYVKQPAAASEPELKAAVAEEAARREKQGSPLPRGRRVTANTSEEVVKPDECKGKEEEKADAKRQSNKEEDATALGVGRRRTSRRAGPAPVAAAPAAEPAAKAAEEKPGNLPPRTRRARQTGRRLRRGPSRRTGAAPVADESAAQPETKAAPQEEEKHGSQLPCARGVTSKPTEPARPDDNAEEEKVKDQEKNNDGVPVQLVGRRGPSRRLRPAPVFLEPEDLWSPPPRGRRVTFNLKSSVPIGTEGSEANEKKDMQREANKGIMAALGVGRRGARGRARPEPAVPEPAGEVAAEQAAPIPRSRRGTGKASESIRVNGNEEENKEELKLDEKEEDVPAQGVARRGPSRRARPVALEPPATRGKEPAISTEAPDVTVEAKLVRPTRARKPAMKAAAVEEEKVPRRTTKKAAATNSTLQNEKQQEEPQETGPALASNEACYDLENVEEAADPHNLEHSKMIDEPKQEDKEVLMNEDDLQMEAILVRPTRVHKPTMKAAVLAEEKVPRRTTKKAAPRKPTLRKQKQQEEPLEAVPAPVSDEARYYLESVEQAADPQNVEQSVVVDEPNQEDKEVDMNKDEMLMVETLAEEPPVTHQTLLEESLSEEPPMTDPQNVEQSKLIDEPNQEVKEVEMNKDEILMADTLAEEPLMEESMSEEPPMTDPQNVEQSKVIDEQNQEVKEVGMNEDETLTVVTPAEEPPVIVKILMEESLTEEASMIDPQNLEQSDVIDKPSQDDKEVEMNEILMVEIPAEETPVIDGETKDKLSVEEQQVVVNPCASTLPVLEDSPVMGLVSKFAKQTFEKDEDDGAHAGEELEKDAGEEMEKDTGKMMGTIQTSEGHADNGSEKDEAVVLDYSGKISSVVEEKAEETMVPELVQNEQVIGNNVTQATMIHGEGAGMEKAKPVTGELTQGTTQLDEDVEEDDFQTDFVMSMN